MNRILVLYILLILMLLPAVQKAQGQGIVQAQVNIGKALYEKKKYEQAEKLFLRVLEAEPSHAISHYYLARIYLESKALKDVEKTKAHYQKAIENEIEFKGEIQRLSFERQEESGPASASVSPESTRVVSNRTPTEIPISATERSAPQPEADQASGTLASVDTTLRAPSISPASSESLAVHSPIPVVGSITEATTTDSGRAAGSTVETTLPAEISSPPLVSTIEPLASSSISETPAAQTTPSSPNIPETQVAQPAPFTLEQRTAPPALGDRDWAAELRQKDRGKLTVEQLVRLATYDSYYAQVNRSMDHDDYGQAIKAAKALSEQLPDDWIGPYLESYAQALAGKYPAAVRQANEEARNRGYDGPLPDADPVNIIQVSLNEARDNIAGENWIEAESALYRVRNIQSYDPIPFKYYVTTDYLLGKVSMGLRDFGSALDDYTRALEEYTRASRDSGYDQITQEQIKNGIYMAQDSLINTPLLPPVDQLQEVFAERRDPYRPDWSSRVGSYTIRMPGYEFLQPDYQKWPEEKQQADRAEKQEEQQEDRSMRGGDIQDVDFNIQKTLKRSAIFTGSGLLLLILLGL